MAKSYRPADLHAAGTAHPLELAAQGAATGLSAGLVIGLGAVAGAALGWAGYGIYRNLKNKKKA